MKSYWDSSALIDAMLDQLAAVKTFETEPQKVTRCHTFAETFSHLTGGRLGFRMDADEVAAKLATLAKEMTVISLDGKETLDALSQARKRGVRGGAVHDFLHAYAAELHGCEKIFTGNISDFEAVTDLAVIQP